MPKAKVKEIKVPKKRGRPKSKKRMYFDEVVQDAIIQYNLSDNDAFRNKIYQERIHYAFDKLAENIINTFKFTYFDMPFNDVKHEVVAFMVMNIHKYDHTKGSKAFSYFSIVAKNYLILHNNANYKKLKIHDNIDTLYEHGIDDDKIDISPSVDIFKKTITYFENHLEELFPKKQDKDVAISILYLCRNKDNIDNFNKKALYIMIREMTDVKTSKITQISNIFRKIYPKIQEQILSKGHIDNLYNTGSL